MKETGNASLILVLKNMLFILLCNEVTVIRGKLQLMKLAIWEIPAVTASACNRCDR